MSNPFSSQTHLSSLQVPPQTLPSLLLGSTHQLLQFTYNASPGNYELVREIELWDGCDYSYLEPHWLQKLSDSFIIAPGVNIFSLREDIPSRQYHAAFLPDRKLLKLSPDLEIIAVREHQEIGAMITANNRVWLCTEGKFIVLDNNLDLVAEIDLNLHGFTGNIKNAHDIIIHENTAYLLDNVVQPTYVLTIDITNPYQPQILNTLGLIGVNHHLKHQWLNPALKQWHIVQSYGTQVESGENILTLPFEIETDSIDLNRGQFYAGLSPDNPQSILLAHQAIASQSFSEPEDYSGITIVTITPLPPHWAVIYENNQSLYFAGVKSQENMMNMIIFKPRLKLATLENCYPPNAQICQHNNLYFLTIRAFCDDQVWTQLFVIDVTRSPQIIFSQDLSEWGVNSYKVAFSLASS